MPNSSVLVFHVLAPRFWIDPKIRNMPLLAKLVVASLLTGYEAVKSARVGIYEIDREDIRTLVYTLDGVDPCSNEVIFDLMGWHEHELKRFLKKDELTEEEKERCKGYFNREKPDILQYDVVTHCIHIKSMFKYAMDSGLIKTPKAIAGAINKTLKLYKNKAPVFLADLAKKYDEELQEAYKKLCPKGDIEVYKNGRAALENLFFLRDAKKVVSANPKLVSMQKMQETLRELNRQN